MAATTIGPYHVLRRLGSGGMGEVYLAEDTRLRRLVALKALHTGAEAPAARRRLLREARAAATLSHPNIAAVYDVIECGEDAHIVMEYVRGETLSQRVRGGPLPPLVVVEIGRQLCDALAAAHRAGVVHRDLKCDNIIVDAEGRAKVLDFGMAQLDAAVSTGTTDTGVPERRALRGTPPYMSPEQFLGGPVDHRTDIYSLGVVLYELLTGRRPFEGKDAATLAPAILSGQHTPVHEVNPVVPAGLGAIVARAMSRDPARRYPSGLDMRADLARLDSGVTADPTMSREMQTGRRPHSRRARAVTIALGAVVAAVSVVWIAGRGRAVPEVAARPAVIAVLPLVNLSGDSSNDPVGIGLAHLLASSLSRISGLTVVSASASLPYADRKTSLRRIAAELGASVVLDGALQEAGDSLRVTVTLVDPGSAAVLWSDSLRIQAGEVAHLQQAVTEGVASSLRLEVSASVRTRVGREPTSDPEALAEFTQARGFLERRDVPGNLERAAVLFQSAIRRDPRFALAHAGLGDTYWARYELTREPEWTVKARDATVEALRLEPDQAAVHYSLAVIYHGTGRRQEALEEVRRALQLQPDNDDVRRLLGRLLAEQGRLAEAVAETRRAIDLRPAYWGGYNALGNVYLQAGRLDEAAAAFQRVIELQPDNAWGYQKLGTTLHMKGDAEGALANYERALKLMPDARSYANMGALLYSKGRHAPAARAFEEAVRLEPNNPALHRNLGDAQRRLGNHARARASFGRAVALLEQHLGVNPNDAPARAMLAVYEAKLGRFDQARRHAHEAVAGAPSSAEVHYRLAVVYALAGHSPGALAALATALEKGYSPAMAQDDDDLTALRRHPGYASLFTRPETTEAGQGGSKP